MHDCQTLQRFAGKAFILFPSAATRGAGDEYFGSGSSEISIVELCGLALTASSPGSVNMMLRTLWGVFVFFVKDLSPSFLQALLPP